MNILQHIRPSFFFYKLETNNQKHGQRKNFRNFLLHFRPASVPERMLRLSLTWGLGGMAVVLLLLLFGSGLMLKLAYEPSPGKLRKRSVFAPDQITYPKKT